jgi:hypothetical protein
MHRPNHAVPPKTKSRMTPEVNRQHDRLAQRGSRKAPEDRAVHSAIYPPAPVDAPLRGQRSCCRVDAGGRDETQHSRHDFDTAARARERGRAATRRVPLPWCRRRLSVITAPTALQVSDRKRLAFPHLATSATGCDCGGGEALGGPRFRARQGSDERRRGTRAFTKGVIAGFVRRGSQTGASDSVRPVW